MNKLVLFSFIITVVFSTTCVFAKESDEQNTKWVHGSLSTGLEQRYLAPRPSRLINDELMIWTNLYLEANKGPAKGLFVNLWNSYGLDDNDWSSNNGDEVDLTLGWNGKAYNLDISISASFFNQHPIEDWEDTWVPTVKVSKEFKFKWFRDDHFIRPQIWIEWLSKTKEFDDGAFVTLSNIKHQWKKPFDIEFLTFSQTIMMPWDDGFDGAENDSDGFFLRWNADLTWKVSDKMLIKLPTFTILQPLTHTDDGRDRRTTSWGFRIIFPF